MGRFKFGIQYVVVNLKREGLMYQGSEPECRDYVLTLSDKKKAHHKIMSFDEHRVRLTNKEKLGQIRKEVR